MPLVVQLYMRLRVKYTRRNTATHRAECAGDRDVKEKTACHQQHSDLCDPSSGDALQEMKLFGWRCAQLSERGGPRRSGNEGRLGSLGDGFSKQTALLF